MKKVECKKSQYHGFHLSNENCSYCPEPLNRIDTLAFVSTEIEDKEWLFTKEPEGKEWYTFGKYHRLEDRKSVV